VKQRIVGAELRLMMKERRASSLFEGGWGDVKNLQNTN